MAKRDCYDVLGITKGASKDDIKKAYRKLALKYHPDKTKGDKASEEKFKEASEAYHILSDDKRKANYDQFGHAAFEGAGGGGGSDITVQEEGSSLSTAATTLNFVGSGVTATGTGSTKTITVAGGGSGIALTDLSVGSEGSASGNGAVAYNSGTGVFTYSPPTLNGLTNAGDVDFGTNKILYSNHYANTGDLPSATTYHGMFAHVHSTGKAYYAHAGAWVSLANESQLTLDGLTGVSTSGVSSGQVLKYNGTSWAPAADSAGSSGIALSDLSVGAEGTASGDGSLGYNNSTGVFTYTPPIIPSVALPDDQEFGVTNSGASAYTFSGAATGNNPTITLQRGKTYRFDVNASGHPFMIRVSNGGSNYTNGVVNAGTQSGAVYFTVPDDAPNSLVYQCSAHAAMVGTITIIDKMVPGHVIQVDQNKMVNVTRTATSSTSYTATNITGTITPRHATSKVLVTVATTANNNNTNNTGMQITLYRGSTELSGSANGIQTAEGRGVRIHVPVGFSYLDSPATTSAVTYTVYVKSSSGSTVEIPFSSGSETALVILQEIAD